MRVGIFHNRYFERGGEDVAADAEAALLGKAGHQVHRFTADNRETLTRSPLAPVRTAFTAHWNPETPRQVDAFLDAHPVDVAHVHNFFPVLSPSLHWALARRGVPVVQTLHNYRLLCANGLFLRDGKPCEDCVTRGPWNALRHGCYRGSRAQTAVWARANRAPPPPRHLGGRGLALHDAVRFRALEAPPGGPAAGARGDEAESRRRPRAADTAR